MKRWLTRRKLVLAFLVIMIAGIGISWRLVTAHDQPPAKPVQHVARVATPRPAEKPKTPAKPAAKPAPESTPPKPAPTTCSTSKLAQHIIVSVSKRTLWGCEGAKQVYTSPVVTGMENLAADLTPRGTFHIYAKQTDLYLKGSDSTGSWNDHVYYWMPFLSNQYGIYGFHDATWRKVSDFGTISPYSDDASHGCVELPLATAKWLYNWAPIGTALTVIN